MEKTEKNIQNQMQPYAVFLDIDGTTLATIDPHNGLPSPFLCRVIREGQKRGHVFFINSGRDIGIIPQDFIKAGGFDGVCAGIGIYAEYHDKVLFEHNLPEAAFHEIVHYCAENGESIVFDSTDKNDPSRYSFGDSGFLQAQFTAYTEEDFYRLMNGKKLHYKLSLSYVPCPAFAEFLNRHIDLITCSASRSEPAYAEGSKRGYSKGTAIDEVCRTLSIPIERSIAIGDSENDLGMLLTAGFSVAMGSAPEKVKNQCDMVTDTVENDGAAKALIKLLSLEDCFETTETERG